MQSVQNKNANELLILERQIQQLYAETISVWRDTDIKKAQAVRMLAARMEEYFIQSGQEQEIDTISTLIAAKLESFGIATAHHVRDYLEAKYKQAEKAHGRAQQGAILEKIVPEITSLEVEHISSEIKQSTFEDLSRFLKQIEADSQKNGYALFHHNDDSFDSSKPKEMERTVSTQKQDPKETEFSDAIQIAIDALTELKKDAMEFPPAWKAQAKVYSQGWLRFAKIIRWLTDDKFSLDAVEWFNKENYRMVQGKHAAAVHDKVETVLCIECSKDLDNDPDCYEIMYADFRSPSGWRCGRCKGTKGQERGMTREQVGDRSYYTQQWAADTIQELPWMTASLYWYRDNKKPINNARKIMLSPKLSKLA